MARKRKTTAKKTAVTKTVKVPAVPVWDGTGAPPARKKPVPAPAPTADPADPEE